MKRFSFKLMLLILTIIMSVTTLFTPAVFAEEQGGNIYTDSLVEFAQPKTKIVGDIMLSTVADSQKALEDIKVEKDFMPANVIVYVNKELKLTDKNGEGEFSDINELFNILDLKATPTFYIQNEETAETLGNYLKDNNIIDANVISASPELVLKIREKHKVLRGAIDYTQTEIDTSKKENLLAIREEANKNKARIVMLSEKIANKETVTYLTDRQMTVWVMGAAESTSEVSAVSMALSGAHGIVSSDPKNVYNTIMKYINKKTFTRSYQTIGHMGVPSLKPENTLEGAIEAYKNGADMIEMDIYMTKDGVIVLNHDNELLKYDENIKIESSNYDDIKSLNFKGHEGIHIPTLEQYFKEFKGKDVILVIEIKSGNSEIVPALKALLDKYDFYDQSYVITFNGSQLINMMKHIPEVPTGYLTAATYSESGALKELLTNVGNFNASYNPRYLAEYDAEYIRDTMFRGVTTRPWTIDDKPTFFSAIKDGHAAVTTNYCQWTADMIEEIFFNDIDVSKCYPGSEIQLSVSQKTHKREISKVNEHVVYKIIGDSDVAKIKGSTLTFNKAGSVTVIAEYSQIVDGVSTFMSEPLEITVYKDAEEAKKNAPAIPKDTDSGLLFVILLAVGIIAAIAVIITVIIIKKKKTEAK